jgi:hypothetical protein
MIAPRWNGKAARPWKTRREGTLHMVPEVTAMHSKLRPSLTKEQFLGEIETEVAGVQYHDTQVEPGQHANLEREPGNHHDRQAIRVEDDHGEPIGYLPRQVTSWLSPLVDAGQIRVDGYFPAVPDPLLKEDPTRRPLFLMTFLSGKGQRLLEKRAPETKLDALHALVRRAYDEAQAFSDPQLLLDFTEGLQPLARQELLPETRLLLALIPGTVREIRAVKSLQTQTAFQTLLGTLRIGTPLHHHNLTLFPLHWPEPQEPPYVLLCRAIELGTAIVEEISESGSVPHLRLVNKGLRPILVPEGEILVGAKQNRVVNVTVLVAAKTTFTLPVSCVEHGRWQYRSKAFQTGFTAPPTLRCKKMRSVQRNRRERGEAASDQGEVWDEVAQQLRAAHVASGTQSLTDGLAGAARQLDRYRANLKLPEAAAGICIAQGKRIVGLDLFDAPSTLAAVWPRLSDAYFFDAARQEKSAQPAATASVEQFLSRLASSARARQLALGLGEELEIVGDGLVGGVLMHAGRLCHLAAFAEVG